MDPDPSIKTGLRSIESKYGYITWINDACHRKVDHGNLLVVIVTLQFHLHYDLCICVSTKIGSGEHGIANFDHPDYNL
jgi:hypothetical protein